MTYLENEKSAPEERCLAKAIRASAPTLPHDYTPAELAALVKYVEGCAHQPPP